MNNNLTELVFVLDRSGSMNGLEQDTIGGFNALIEKQKQEPGKVLISTVLFNQKIQIIHDRVDLDQVPPMTEQDYFPQGCTALLDALGGALHHIGSIHKYAREEDRPGKTIFVIITDGLENSSRRYSNQQVREMVERQQEQYGWEFLFLGANMDAIAQARNYGIAADRAVRYACDSEGTVLNYESVSNAVYSIRRHEKLSPGWKARIEEDYRRRGRK